MLRKLGNDPNLLQILVTLIPPHWHFSLIETKLELSGILRKKKDLALPGPPSDHYKQRKGKVVI